MSECENSNEMDSIFSRQEKRERKRNLCHRFQEIISHLWRLQMDGILSTYCALQKANIFLFAFRLLLLSLHQSPSKGIFHFANFIIFFWFVFSFHFLVVCFVVGQFIWLRDMWTSTLIFFILFYFLVHFMPLHGI